MNQSTSSIVRLKQPTTAQLKFLRSPAKRKIVRAGRRSGKTTGSAIIACEKFLEGRRVLYATPTESQSESFWREVTTALAPAIDAGIFKKNESERFIERPGTPQRLKCKTAWDADTLRGDYADFLVLDEFQLMAETTWTEVGAPMLLDFDGDAIFVYTPPSLHSRAITQAHDPRHAAKLFVMAKKDRSGRWAAFHFTSFDNPHIPREALASISADMTDLSYRQEILAEDITEVPGALWKQSVLDKTRVSRESLPELTRIVVGVDPSGSARTEAGIVAAGCDKDGNRFVLRDASLLASSPEAWASAAVLLYHELGADSLVIERNFGGDMCRATVLQIDPRVNVRDIVSSRGKLIRAEPQCAAFERNRAHLAGSFPELESELCTYVPGNLSPNRLDAMVFALAELDSGHQVFGLLDAMRTGWDGFLETFSFRPKAVPVAEEKTVAEIPLRVGAVKPLVKQWRADRLPNCEECGSSCTTRLNSAIHCNQCRADFFPDGEPVNPASYFTRKQFLRGVPPPSRARITFPGGRS